MISDIYVEMFVMVRNVPKVDNFYSFTFFIMTPIFELYVVRCVSNIKLKTNVFDKD